MQCLLTTNGQLNDTRGYHIKPINSTCNMISWFSLKGPCLFVRSQILIIVEKCYQRKKYFDKYKNKNIYVKIRVALGVCFSILIAFLLILFNAVHSVIEQYLWKWNYKIFSCFMQWHNRNEMCPIFTQKLMFIIAHQNYHDIVGMQIISYFC